MHGTYNNEASNMLNNHLLQQKYLLLPKWLPGGTFETQEYVASYPNDDNQQRQDLSINIRTGRWRNIITQDKGKGLNFLYAYLKGINYSEAAKVLLEESRLS